MPPECKKFVADLHSFLDTTNKLFYELPLHKLWKTRNWKELLRSQKDMFSYTSKLVNEKIREIEAENSMEVQLAELGTDFLTYMVHSGSLSVGEIAINAIDLLGAGVDTVSLNMKLSVIFEVIILTD